MKARKHQSRKQRCCGLCSKLPDRAQSFVFFFYKLLLYKLMRRFYWLLCSK